MVGWTDLPADLSDTPKLRRVAGYLPNAATTVTSDLIRARDTADALHLSGPRLAGMTGLREIHFGAWEMKGFDEVDNPDHIRAFWDDPGDVAPPNGESWNAFGARVDAATDQILAMGIDDIIVVCHFGVIVRQIQRALRVPAREAFGHRIANLSVTRIDVVSGEWSAPSINHQP